LAFVVIYSLAEIGLAHYLWIEKEQNGDARVFFGEYQERVKEITGGRLDQITGPRFDAIPVKGKGRKVKYERRADHLEVRGVKGDRLLVTEADHPVQDLREYEIGIVKPMFYARTEAPTGTMAAPALNLDIVPTEKKNEFRVFFKQQPAAGFKIMVYAPNLWMQELKTAEDGLVNIETPWPGQYVLDVVHKEAASGEFKGTAYEAVRHRATCSLLR
jgi:hypothetical protein